MGKCINCETEIKLEDNEENCPNCGKKPYTCWNCGTDISGAEFECKVCGFFECEGCGCCGQNCQKKEWYPIIKQILGDKYHSNIGKKLADFIATIKFAPERKNCPKGVPISYGHGKLKNMACRLKGVGVRNKLDADAFEKRFEHIIEHPVGKTWIISKEKEDGHYGIELREVSNLGICMGKVKKRKIKEKNSEGKVIKEYELFERVEEQQCPNANWDKLITKYCYKCKKTFPETSSICLNCVYSKGKQKGQPVELKIRKSKTHFCQLNRSEYEKNKTRTD